MSKSDATEEDVEALLQEAGAMFGDPALIAELLTAKQFTPTVIAKAIAATDKSHSCQVTYMDAMERKKLIERLARED
jgi:hypothetical protein